MGYNIELACHSCREQTGALRGDEATMIALWRADHPRPCRVDIGVDNGWKEMDLNYPDVSERYYDKGWHLRVYTNARG